MRYKFYASLLALIAPLVALLCIYLLGWLITIVLIAFGIPISAARIAGIALSFLVSFLFISFIAQQK